MVRQIPVKGYFAESCYVYIDDTTKHGFLIDPGAEAERLLALIRKNGWHIDAILLTHGHFDHFGAVNELRHILGVPVYAHEARGAYLTDPKVNLSIYCGPPMTVERVESLRDGQTLTDEQAPSLRLRVLHTPGHTTDSVTLYDKAAGIAFVGDTIFKGSIGTDQYPGGNRAQLLRSIQTVIFSLPENTVLYSGHSAPTTVGIEKERYRI